MNCVVKKLLAYFLLHTMKLDEANAMVLIFKLHCSEFDVGAPVVTASWVARATRVEVSGVLETDVGKLGNGTPAHFLVVRILIIDIFGVINSFAEFRIFN